MLHQHFQTPQVSQSSSSAQWSYRNAPATSSIDRLSVVLLRQKVREQNDVITAHGIVQGLTLLIVLIFLLRLQQGEYLRNVHQTHDDSSAQDHNVAAG